MIIPRPPSTNETTKRSCWTPPAAYSALSFEALVLTWPLAPSQNGPRHPHQFSQACVRSHGLGGARSVTGEADDKREPKPKPHEKPQVMEAAQHDHPEKDQPATKIAAVPKWPQHPAIPPSALTRVVSASQALRHASRSARCLFPYCHKCCYPPSLQWIRLACTASP